jgi:hypothetical protein
VPFLSYFEERERDAEKRGLLTGIQAVLSVQLPKQAKTLMTRAEQVNDLDLLRRVLKAAVAADRKTLKKLLP